ncbi:MAG: ArsA family ATPase [Actinomycetota bacterium]
MNGASELVGTSSLVVVCGSGGVGKTTMAAAIGTALAVERDARVLVLTVDPARRLADALGLTGIGNEAVAVDVAAHGGRGLLHVAMIDTKVSWDALIARHAPTPDVRDRVLANPLYRNLTERFVHSHDYIAMERLYAEHTSGDYDLIVVDTPPSRNALDVLDAPRRMREFFGSRLLKLLTTATSTGVLSLASRPFFQVADRILGQRFLSDISEFFTLLRSMEAGFVTRASEVEATLRDERTAFVVVTTLETAPLYEAQYLIAELAQRSYSLRATVANRVIDADLVAEARRAAARLGSLDARSDVVARLVARLDGTRPEDVARVLNQAIERTGAFDDVSRVQGKRLEQLRTALESRGSHAWVSGLRSNDVTDVVSLVELGRGLARA